MPNYTTNLNLEKPLQSEQYNIDVFNSNADKIDQFAGQVPARALTADKLTTGAKINGVNFKGDTDIVTGAGFYYNTVTYSEGDLAFIYNQDGALELHKSLSAGNVGHNPLTTTGYWEKVELGGSGGRNVGEIITSSLPLTDAGLHLLDGSRLSGDGIYGEFVDYIAELFNSSVGDSEIRTNPVMTSNNAPYGTASSTGTLYSTSQPFAMLAGATSSTAWTTSNGSITYTFDTTKQPVAGTYRFYFQYGSYDASGRSLNNVVITVTYEDDTTSTINVGDLTGQITATNSYYVTSEFTTSKKIKSFTLSHSGSSINITTMNIGNFQLQRMVPNYFTDETTWQTSVTTYGSCGKFVYDSTNNTVRLPKVSDILQSTTDINALGDLVEAGLPVPSHTHTRGDMNIRGTWASRGIENWGVDARGCFYHAGDYGKGAGGERAASATIGFDASRNWTGSTSQPDGLPSVYGNSSTVQPQTIKCFVYMVIATSSKTDIQSNIDNIATDLNGKSDTDLSNCTKPHIVETYQNGTSWYRVYSDGWCEQGGKFVITTASIDANSYNSATLTFLKPFNKCITYNVQAKHDRFNVGFETEITGQALSAVSVYQVNDASTTSFTNPYVIWQAGGYIN